MRLKNAYVLTCKSFSQNAAGEITELICEYNPETFAGATPPGMKKVKGIINWVSAVASHTAEFRLYDRLFSVPSPESDKDLDFKTFMNPQSLRIVQGRLENNLKNAKLGERFQFERQGYFIKDQDSTDGLAVYNRTVTLRDTWAQESKKSSQ